MKLKLTQQRDVAIFDVTEDIPPAQIPILKAGIAKIIGSGKKKLVLSLIEAKPLTVEVAIGMLSLQTLVVQMGGEFAFVGQVQILSEASKQSNPKVNPKCFVSKEIAVNNLSPPGSKSKLLAQTGSNTELKAMLDSLQKENASLKEKLATRDVEEVRRLRYENGVFQIQLSAMEEQIKAIHKEPKKVTTLVDGVETKLQQLETALEVFLDKEGLIPRRAK